LEYIVDAQWRRTMSEVRSLLVPKKIIRGLLGAGWLAFALSVLLRPHRGVFSVWLDVGLYNLVWVFAVAACVMRARQNDRERWAWVMFSAGLSLYLLGNVYGSLVVGAKDVYPSPADALWLASYGCVYIGIVLLTRARSVRFYLSSWLDGAIGGLGLAALAVTCFLGPVLVATNGDFGIVATNLSYPIAEIVLIVLLVSFGSMIPRPRGAAWWLLGAGLAVICIGDAAYLFTRALGLYQEGGFLDVSWPLGAVLIGQAALTKAPTRVVKETSRRTWLIFPAGFAAISVGLLVHGQFAPLSKTAAVLAGAALMLALGRMVWNLRETGQLAETRAQARTDDLTRLPNRRAFNEVLTEYLAKPAAPLGLLLMDLDRFKEVNDSLGHSAGDRLLEMVGARLSGAVRQ
jgi:diguanylate cyclase